MADDRNLQRRAEELFHELVELAPAQRAEELAARCDDPETCREVEALLAQADRSTDPLREVAAAAHPDETNDATMDGPGFESVFEILAGGGALSRISLHDVLGDDSPVLRPLHGAQPELPERIGRYHVSGEIARGGVGSVWKARDLELGREIALKVLLNRHDGNPDATRRFVEEAQIGAQLQHPGIVPVHDMGLVSGKKPYFAMKLVKGQTLATLLDERRDRAQDRQRFLSIFEQICQPLAYAHARGVIHRDLKPSNVMVGSFGEVQVMDWGLAKVLARGGIEDDDRVTRVETQVSVIETVRSGSTGSESVTGSVMGTPAYMPPEQARGEASPRSWIQPHLEQRSARTK